MKATKRFTRLRLAAGLCLVIPACFAWAAEEPLVIEQINRAFSKKDVEIGLGNTLRFMNHDEFDHQIYVESPSFNFESDEAPPGSEVDLRFTTRGTFIVQCHIHPKMHLSVVVH